MALFDPPNAASVPQTTELAWVALSAQALAPAICETVYFIPNSFGIAAARRTSGVEEHMVDGIECWCQPQEPLEFGGIHWTTIPEDLLASHCHRRTDAMRVHAVGGLGPPR